MVKRGYRVIYINVDVASVDTRQMRNQAEKDGIDLLVPEVAGSGVDDVIKNLNSMSRAQTPYNHTVIVLDTLRIERKTSDTYAQLIPRASMT
jgi:hypothetical protein